MPRLVSIQITAIVPDNIRANEIQNGIADAIVNAGIIKSNDELLDCFAELLNDEDETEK